MTSSQVLELNLSVVQFEDLSDEMASNIQGGTELSENVLAIAHDLTEFWDDISRENNGGDVYASLEELYVNLRNTIFELEGIEDGIEDEIVI